MDDMDDPDNIIDAETAEELERIIEEKIKELKKRKAGPTKLKIEEYEKELERLSGATHASEVESARVELGGYEIYLALRGNELYLRVRGDVYFEEVINLI